MFGKPRNNASQLDFLVLTSNHKIYAGAIIKKNSLKIFFYPFGTLELVKAEEAKGKRTSSVDSKLLVTVKKQKQTIPGVGSKLGPEEGDWQHCALLLGPANR